MKILWILNMVLPKVANEIGISSSFSGGWLVDLSNKLSLDENIELATMTYYSGNEYKDVTVDGIRNFIFPGGGKRLLFNNKKTVVDCQKVIDEFKPDLIHIHGTEYAIGYSVLKTNTNIPVLLTIQGVLSRISEEYYGGLKFKELLKVNTLKEHLKLKNIFFTKRLFKMNAKREQYILKNVKYVTGRTDWDKSTMLAINPNLKYYRSHYSLREEFYNSDKWDYEKIDKYTIYAGASTYTLKGFHILLKALQIVKQKYNNVKLYMPGFKAKDGRILNPNGYGRYINKLIKEYDLVDNVEFVGSLKAKEVAEYLSKSHICVVSSAMEGLSATINEAMMIGTPSICPFRGGMSSSFVNGISGFHYDYSEYPMLAERIINLFENKELCESFSKEGKKIVLERHDREKNVIVLKEIYKEILCGD